MRELFKIDSKYILIIYYLYCLVGSGKHCILDASSLRSYLGRFVVRGIYFDFNIARAVLINITSVQMCRLVDWTMYFDNVFGSSLIMAIHPISSYMSFTAFRYSMRDRTLIYCYFISFVLPSLYNCLPHKPHLKTIKKNYEFVAPCRHYTPDVCL